MPIRSSDRNISTACSLVNAIFRLMPPHIARSCHSDAERGGGIYFASRPIPSPMLRASLLNSNVSRFHPPNRTAQKTTPSQESAAQLIATPSRPPVLPRSDWRQLPAWHEAGSRKESSRPPPPLAPSAWSRDCERNKTWRRSPSPASQSTQTPATSAREIGISSSTGLLSRMLKTSVDTLSHS